MHNWPSTSLPARKPIIRLSLPFFAYLLIASSLISQYESASIETSLFSDPKVLVDTLVQWFTPLASGLINHEFKEQPGRRWPNESAGT
jgi:hypothetical protein